MRGILQTGKGLTPLVNKVKKKKNPPPSGGSPFQPTATDRLMGDMEGDDDDVQESPAGREDESELTFASFDASLPYESLDEEPLPRPDSEVVIDIEPPGDLIDLHDDETVYHTPRGSLRSKAGDTPRGSLRSKGDGTPRSSLRSKADNLLTSQRKSGVTDISGFYTARAPSIQSNLPEGSRKGSSASRKTEEGRKGSSASRKSEKESRKGSTASRKTEKESSFFSRKQVIEGAKGKGRGKRRSTNVGGGCYPNFIGMLSDQFVCRPAVLLETELPRKISWEAPEDRQSTATGDVRKQSRDHEEGSKPKYLTVTEASWVPDRLSSVTEDVRKASWDPGENSMPKHLAVTESSWVPDKLSSVAEDVRKQSWDPEKSSTRKCLTSTEASWVPDKLSSVAEDVSKLSWDPEESNKPASRKTEKESSLFSRKQVIEGAKGKGRGKRRSTDVGGGCYPSFIGMLSDQFVCRPAVLPETELPRKISWEAPEDRQSTATGDVRKQSMDPEEGSMRKRLTVTEASWVPDRLSSVEEDVSKLSWVPEESSKEDTGRKSSHISRMSEGRSAHLSIAEEDQQRRSSLATRKSSHKEGEDYQGRKSSLASSRRKSTFGQEEIEEVGKQRHVSIAEDQLDELDKKTDDTSEHSSKESDSKSSESSEATEAEKTEDEAKEKKRKHRERVKKKKASRPHREKGMGIKFKLKELTTDNDSEALISPSEFFAAVSSGDLKKKASRPHREKGMGIKSKLKKLTTGASDAKEKAKRVRKKKASGPHREKGKSKLKELTTDGNSEALLSPSEFLAVASGNLKLVKKNKSSPDQSADEKKEARRVRKKKTSRPHREKGMGIKSKLKKLTTGASDASADEKEKAKRIKKKKTSRPHREKGMGTKSKLKKLTTDDSGALLSPSRLLAMASGVLKSSPDPSADEKEKAKKARKKKTSRPHREKGMGTKSKLKKVTTDDSGALLSPSRLLAVASGILKSSPDPSADEKEKAKRVRKKKASRPHREKGMGIKSKLKKLTTGASDASPDPSADEKEKAKKARKKKTSRPHREKGMGTKSKLKELTTDDSGALLSPSRLLAMASGVLKSSPDPSADEKEKAKKARKRKASRPHREKGMGSKSKLKELTTESDDEVLSLSEFLAKVSPKAKKSLSPDDTTEEEADEKEARRVRKRKAQKPHRDKGMGTSKKQLTEDDADALLSPSEFDKEVEKSHSRDKASPDEAEKTDNGSKDKKRKRDKKEKKADTTPEKEEKRERKKQKREKQSKGKSIDTILSASEFFAMCSEVSEKEELKKHKSSTDKRDKKEKSSKQHREKGKGDSKKLKELTTDDAERALQSDTAEECVPTSDIVINIDPPSPAHDGMSESHDAHTVEEVGTDLVKRGLDAGKLKDQKTTMQKVTPVVSDKSFKTSLLSDSLSWQPPTLSSEDISRDVSRKASDSGAVGGKDGDAQKGAYDWRKNSARTQSSTASRDHKKEERLLASSGDEKKCAVSDHGSSVQHKAEKSTKSHPGSDNEAGSPKHKPEVDDADKFSTKSSVRMKKIMPDDVDKLSTKSSVHTRPVSAKSARKQESPKALDEHAPIEQDPDSLDEPEPVKQTTRKHGDSRKQSDVSPQPPSPLTQHRMRSSIGSAQKDRIEHGASDGEESSPAAKKTSRHQSPKPEGKAEGHHRSPGQKVPAKSPDKRAGVKVDASEDKLKSPNSPQKKGFFSNLFHPLSPSKSTTSTKDSHGGGRDRAERERRHRKGDEGASPGRQRAGGRDRGERERRYRKGEEGASPGKQEVTSPGEKSGEEMKKTLLNNIRH